MSTVTLFPNVYANTLRVIDWLELEKIISGEKLYPSKGTCPLIKLARFGETRSDKGSLRHDENVIEITGIEGDYDDEKITIESAAETARLIGLNCLIYSSPSHTPEKPRWRLLARTSKPYPPTARKRFAQRIDFLFRGKLDSASLKLSQSFFVGRVEGAPYEVIPVDDGYFIDSDALDVLDQLESDTRGRGKYTNAGAASTNVPDDVVADLRSALRSMPSDDYCVWVDLGLALKSIGDQGKALWLEWSSKSGKYDHEVALAKWETFNPTHIHYASVFAAAQKMGWQNPKSGPAKDVSIDDFYGYMPMHKFIFKPTGELWPAESINARLPHQPVGDGKMRPAAWLDRFAPVEQMTWAPCEPQLISDKLIDRGGWIDRQGCHVFNLYRPPPILAGDPSKAVLWRDHLARIFPDEARHIECWLAHHIQKPGDKVNHCLVLRGQQGVGKDTILEPVKCAVGAWNWQEIAPVQMLGRFNEWCRSVIVRVNEARDLGDYDRFAFYDHSKVYMAAPPDVLRVDEKHLREYYVPNVLGIIITTNHEVDGICLDADDRRHFVANSEATKEDFDGEYWTSFWNWYAEGGLGHVAAYLRELDLSEFDSKAPPPKTEAFWRIVHSNAAPEDADLAGLIEALSNPQILTLSQLAQRARGRHEFDIADFLTSLKTRRNVQHRLQQQGYLVVRNQDRKDGLWLVDGKRQTVYAVRKLSYRNAVEAIRRTFFGSEVH